MKKLQLIILALLTLCGMRGLAWKGQTLSPLHIEGRYLCDSNGNHVTLHGYAQTYSPWFNEQGKGWGWGKNPSACLTYNQGLIAKIDAAGWKCNWLRLHMDPFWSNKDGVSTTGESDISAFDETLFIKYLDEVFVPMAEYAISYGLYVVMRPPGVCPEKIGVGDSYHQYLRKVWKIVCSHSKLKNNPYVMFELANEPINMNDGSGNYTSYSDGSQKKCTEFFQQIVDDIRSLGCNNILWIPGLAYQQNYQGYVKYPVVEPTNDSLPAGRAGESPGLGIGYAVHCYPGWYGSDAEVASAEQKVETAGAGYVEFRDGWEASIAGVAEKSPILVTEMDWAPKKYSSSWGKATTGVEGGVGFGANFHFIMDKTGNVSWLLFTDANLLAKYDDSAADGDTFLTDPEACPRPIYRWYRQYADNPDFSSYSAEREKHILDSIQAVKDALASQPWYYPNNNDTFNPNIWETGSLTNNSDGSVSLVTGKYGFGGFQFTGGRDLSKFKYLVVNLVTAPASGGWSLRLFDANNYWGKPFMTNVTNTRTVVKLHEMTNDSGEKIDPSHIYILGFWSYGGATLNIKDIYVTNNNDYTADDIDCVTLPVGEGRGETYNLSGQRIATSVPGSIIIRDGHKYISR